MDREKFPEYKGQMSHRSFNCYRGCYILSVFFLLNLKPFNSGRSSGSSISRAIEGSSQICSLIPFSLAWATCLSNEFSPNSYLISPAGFTISALVPLPLWSGEITTTGGAYIDVEAQEDTTVMSQNERWISELSDSGLDFQGIHYKMCDTIYRLDYFIFSG